MDLLLSFLKPEDILMLCKILPMVIDCPKYKRLMGKTKPLNEMWDKVVFEASTHENCIHVCLSQITVNPHHNCDAFVDNTDGMVCYFDGRGIFCLASNDLKEDIDPRYHKTVVPIKKHYHCNCEKNENSLCDVHEDSEEYVESISFEKRRYNGGYVEDFFHNLACE